MRFCTESLNKIAFQQTGHSYSLKSFVIGQINKLPFNLARHWLMKQKLFKVNRKSFNGDQSQYIFKENTQWGDLK